MAQLPTGMATFLFTDVEGSTRLFEEAPDLMLTALRRHDEIIEEAVSSHRGVVVRPRGEGDSRFAVFTIARDAIECAAAVQRRLQDSEWDTPEPIRVRVALHTGYADLHAGDYYGSAVNRAARLRGIVHGGQTVMSRSTWELVRDDLPDDVTVKDLGEADLKDLARRERVYQLTPEGMRDSFPPLASRVGVPNTLPEQVTMFIGRTAEVTDAGRLLGEGRLLTVAGPGGTGKTRLAIQVANEAAAEYSDGVYFVGLADTGADDDMIDTITDSLGVPVSHGEDAKRRLFAYLGKKRVLLMLDNLEHLEAASGIVHEILEYGPHVTVLATSRYRLGLTGETVLTLGGFETTWDSTDDALQSSAFHMFRHAARRADPAFTLDDQDLAALSDIMRLTGGLPLAIMLAAAWVDVLPVREIAAEIERSADFLETEMADVPDRQRSVRAVFESSWSLLGDSERDAYMRLAVFRGGFTREAARAIAGADLRTLKRLSGKSLLQRDVGANRHSMHRLLRQYALRQLRESGGAADVHTAHMKYYMDLMAREWTRMQTSEQLDALRQLETEFENVRAAWHWAAAHNCPDEIDRSLEPLYWFCSIRARVPAGEALFEAARESFPRSFDADAHPVRRRLALRFENQGDEIGGEIERMLEVSRSHEAPAETAYFLWMLGVNRYASKDFARAIAVLQESHDLLQDQGQDFYRIEALHLLAVCKRFLGQAAEARVLEARVRDLSRRTGNRYALGRLLGVQGLLTVLETNDARAKDDLLEAIAIREELGDDAGVAVSLASLSVESLFRGDLANARQYAEESRSRAVESSSEFPRTFALSVLGWLAVIDEAYEDARDLGRESLEHSPDPNTEFSATLALAMAACGLQDYVAAEMHVQSVLQTHSLFRTDKGLTTILPVVAILQASRGHAERAAELLALAFHHPMSARGWLDKWTLLDRLKADLESELGSEGFAAAWRRGADMDLETVIGEEQTVVG